MGAGIHTGNKFGTKLGKCISIMKKLLLKKEKKVLLVPELLHNDPLRDVGPTFLCNLCLHSIHLDYSFNINGCTHFYCRQCVVKFIVFNLNQNVSHITCPVAGCAGVLDPEYCRPILPKDVFDSWCNGLCESLIATDPKYGHVDPTFTCDFCVESVHLKDSFNIKGCTHFYCQECVVKFIVSKLEDNVTFITCPVPNCTGFLDLPYCLPILPYNVYERWGNALCESAVKGSQNKYIYCPYSACSALLVNEEPEGTIQSHCPHCMRDLCAKCKVPWHTEFNCKKFQELRNKGEDMMLEELAKNKKWRRCPSCSSYVERIGGCSYMKCRCGFAFCYKCGIQALQDSHTYYCQSCRR